jgi:hypothetical protein
VLTAAPVDAPPSQAEQALERSASSFSFLAPSALSPSFWASVILFFAEARTGSSRLPVSCLRNASMPAVSSLPRPSEAARPRQRAACRNCVLLISAAWAAPPGRNGDDGGDDDLFHGVVPSTSTDLMNSHMPQRHAGFKLNRSHLAHYLRCNVSIDKYYSFLIFHHRLFVNFTEP